MESNKVLECVKVTKIIFFVVICLLLMGFNFAIGYLLSYIAQNRLKVKPKKIRIFYGGFIFALIQIMFEIKGLMSLWKGL